MALSTVKLLLLKRIDAVPLTRDYMTDWERGHAPPLPADMAAE